MPHPRAEYNRAWREAHPERVRHYQRQRSLAHPGKATEDSRKWAKENPERREVLNRRSALKRKYGLTVEQFDDMLYAQGGACALCGTTNPGGHGRFHVDHSAVTGRVRELLCTRCNLGLGFFTHDSMKLQQAIQYLHKHEE